MRFYRRVANIVLIIKIKYLWFLIIFFSFIFYSDLIIAKQCPAFAQTSTIKKMDIDDKPNLSITVIEQGRSNFYQINLTNVGIEPVYNLSIRLNTGEERYIHILDPGHTYTWTAQSDPTNNQTVNVYQADITDPIIEQHIIKV